MIQLLNRQAYMRGCIAFVRSTVRQIGVFGVEFLQAVHVVGIAVKRTLPVAGSRMAPLTPMVKLGMGFDSVKLVMICIHHTRTCEYQQTVCTIAHTLSEYEGGYTSQELQMLEGLGSIPCQLG